LTAAYFARFPLLVLRLPPVPFAICTHLRVRKIAFHTPVRNPKESPHDRGFGPFSTTPWSHRKARGSPPIAVLGRPYPIRQRYVNLALICGQGSTTAPPIGVRGFYSNWL
jgi:hypothetical protein